jgi:hypothetical protein
MLRAKGILAVEITEETAELVARVAALDIGKAELVCCARVPHETVSGRRRQEVRTFATVTRSLLELRDWLACQDVILCVMQPHGGCRMGLSCGGCGVTDGQPNGPVAEIGHQVQPPAEGAVPARLPRSGDQDELSADVAA